MGDLNPKKGGKMEDRVHIEDFAYRGLQGPIRGTFALKRSQPRPGNRPGFGKLTLMTAWLSDAPSPPCRVIFG